MGWGAQCGHYFNATGALRGHCLAASRTPWHPNAVSGSADSLPGGRWRRRWGGGRRGGRGRAARPRPSPRRQGDHRRRHRPQVPDRPLLPRAGPHGTVGRADQAPPATGEVSGGVARWPWLLQPPLLFLQGEGRENAAAHHLPQGSNSNSHTTEKTFSFVGHWAPISHCCRTYSLLFCMKQNLLLLCVHIWDPSAARGEECIQIRFDNASILAFERFFKWRRLLTFSPGETRAPTSFMLKVKEHTGST